MKKSKTKRKKKKSRRRLKKGPKLVLLLIFLAALFFALKKSLDNYNITFNNTYENLMNKINEQKKKISAKGEFCHARRKGFVGTETSRSDRCAGGCLRVRGRLHRCFCRRALGSARLFGHFMRRNQYFGRNGGAGTFAKGRFGFVRTRAHEHTSTRAHGNARKKYTGITVITLKKRAFLCKNHEKNQN